MQAMLCEAIEPPAFVSRSGRRVFRYPARSAPQAIVQKLARAVSDLDASSLLLEHGFVQEVAILGRALDDLFEDVMFLTKAILADGEQDLLQRYLNNFYDEVIEDPEDVVGSLLKKRSPVQRREVREATERLDLQLFGHVEGFKPTTELQRAVSTIYNSYVHAGSPQIMDMYGGSSPIPRSWHAGHPAGRASHH